MRPLSTLRAATVNTPDVLRAMRNLWLDRLVHLAQRRPARSRFVRGKSFNQFQRRRKQPSRPTKPGILNRSKPLVLKGRKRPSQTPPHSTTKETRRPPRAMPNASMRLLTWAASEYVLMILDRAMPNASTRLLTAANYHAEARHPTKATHDNQQKFTYNRLAETRHPMLSTQDQKRLVAKVRRAVWEEGFLEAPALSKYIFQGDETTTPDFHPPSRIGSFLVRS